jgi:hypothetical protein
MNIGFDFDGVIVPTAGKVREAVKNKFRLDKFVINKYLANDLDTTDEIKAYMNELYDSPEFMGSLHIPPEVQHVLHYLTIKVKATVCVITARPPEMRDATEHILLNSPRILPFQLDSVHYSKDKRKLCDHLNLKYFVEDCLEQAVSIALYTNVKKVFLLNDEYNQFEPGMDFIPKIKRVHNGIMNVVHEIQKEEKRESQEAQRDSVRAAG